MKRVFAIIFTFCCFKYGVSKVLSPLAIDFEDCGGSLELTSIAISTCTYIPCKIERGNFAEVTIEFDPSNSPYQANSLHFDAHWFVDGLQQQALLFPDYCSANDCIHESPNGLLQFTVSVYVSDALPRGLYGYLQWKTMYATNNELLMCSRIPVFIY